MKRHVKKQVSQKNGKMQSRANVRFVSYDPFQSKMVLPYLYNLKMSDASVISGMRAPRKYDGSAAATRTKGGVIGSRWKVP